MLASGVSSFRAKVMSTSRRIAWPSSAVASFWMTLNLSPFGRSGLRPYTCSRKSSSTSGRLFSIQSFAELTLVASRIVSGSGSSYFGTLVSS